MTAYYVPSSIDPCMDCTTTTLTIRIILSEEEMDLPFKFPSSAAIGSRVEERFSISREMKSPSNKEKREKSVFINLPLEELRVDVCCRAAVHVLNSGASSAHKEESLIRTIRVKCSRYFGIGI